MRTAPPPILKTYSLEHYTIATPCFGGIAMKWIAEAAHIMATRLLRQEAVTVGAESIKFVLSAGKGSNGEIVGKAAKMGSVNLKAEVLVEDRDSNRQEKPLELLFGLQLKMSI